MIHPFKYGKTELSYLSAADRKMAALIEQCEVQHFRPMRPVDDNAFNCLIKAINDQLISLKAAASIWKRITKRFGDPVDPNKMSRARVTTIQKCGTTFKKAEYMSNIAKAVVSKKLDLENLQNADDETILQTLIELKGIGQWTAEMLLIHCFERPDVISFGDAGIRRGLCMLYNIDKNKLDQKCFLRLTKKYHPYATTASIYLWWLSKQ